MLSLAGRLGYSLQLYASSRPVPDTALLVISTAAGFWLISLISSFALSRRGRAAPTIVLAGIAIFIIQLSDSHVGDHMGILAIFSALCLLLLGRMTFVRKRIAWKEQHVTFSTEAWNDLNISLPAAALILVLAAWMARVTGRPIVSAKVWWERLTRPLDETRKNLGNVSAGVRSEQVKTTEFYGNSLAMGQNAQQATSHCEFASR
jgi:hypothetical protein